MKLTLGSVLGSAWGIVASKGIIAGQLLNVHNGFCLYGWTLTDLSIRFFLYAFACFKVDLLLCADCKMFSSFLGVSPSWYFLQFI